MPNTSFSNLYNKNYSTRLDQPGYDRLDSVNGWPKPPVVPDHIQQAYDKYWPHGSEYTFDPQSQAKSTPPEAWHAKNLYHLYANNPNLSPNAPIGQPLPDPVEHLQRYGLGGRGVPESALYSDTFKRVANRYGANYPLMYPRMATLDNAASFIDYGATGLATAGVVGGLGALGKAAPGLTQAASGLVKALPGGRAIQSAAQAASSIPQVFQQVEGAAPWANYLRGIGQLNYGALNPIAGIRTMAPMMEFQPGQALLNAGKGLTGAFTLPQFLSHAARIPGVMYNKYDALQQVGSDPLHSALGAGMGALDNLNFSLPIPGLTPGMARLYDTLSPAAMNMAASHDMPQVADALNLPNLNSANRLVRSVAGNFTSSAVPENASLSLLTGGRAIPSVHQQTYQANNAMRQGLADSLNAEQPIDPELMSAIRNTNPGMLKKVIEPRIKALQEYAQSHPEMKARTDKTLEYYNGILNNTDKPNNAPSASAQATNMTI